MCEFMKNGLSIICTENRPQPIKLRDEGVKWKYTQTLPKLNFQISLERTCACKNTRYSGLPRTTLCLPPLQKKLRLRSRRLLGPSNPVTTLQDSKTNIPHSLPPFCSYCTLVSIVEWRSRVPLTHNWEVRLQLLISIESNVCCAHLGLPERSSSRDILEADHTSFLILIWGLIYVD